MSQQLPPEYKALNDDSLRAALEHCVNQVRSNMGLAALIKRELKKRARGKA